MRSWCRRAAPRPAGARFGVSRRPPSIRAQDRVCADRHHKGAEQQESDSCHFEEMIQKAVSRAGPVETRQRRPPELVMSRPGRVPHLGDDEHVGQAVVDAVEAAGSQATCPGEAKRPQDGRARRQAPPIVTEMEEQAPVRGGSAEPPDNRFRRNNSCVGSPIASPFSPPARCSLARRPVAAPPIRPAPGRRACATT